MSENRRVKDVTEYLEEVSKIKAKWPNSILAFRGQEKEKWLLESSAERRLKASLPSQEGITAPFLEYNENLIKKCRLKNYDKREQKQLYDLELLADLQHHGAATCLIDFTRNALVALWFACQKSDDADGKVFVVNIADQRTFLEITHTDIKEAKSISDILQFKNRNTDQDQSAGRPTPEISVASPNFWYWTPAHLNERIPAQHSLFLFGLPCSGELGAEEIIIESASKKQIRKELEALHDIREEFLFPDFVGFAYIQRADAPYLTLDSEEYFYSGVKAQQRGQYSESIQDLTKAIELKIELEEDYAEAYYARGLAYDRKGEYDQAIQDLTKAIELKIELEEDYAEVYYDRGSAYYSKGEYDQAIQDLTKAIELKEDYAEAHAFRGLAYACKGEYDQAIQDLTKAIELKKDYAEAYLICGSAYHSKGEYDQAIQDLTKAIELKEDYADAYLARGHVYRNQGKYDHAIQDLTKAIELNPDYADAYYFRGRAYSSQGEHDYAIANFTKAIKLNPKLADAYYARALACFGLERWQNAKSDLVIAKNAALDIITSFHRSYKSVADFEQKTGITLPEDIAAMLTESEN